MRRSQTREHENRTQNLQKAHLTPIEIGIPPHSSRSTDKGGVGLPRRPSRSTATRLAVYRQGGSRYTATFASVDRQPPPPSEVSPLGWRPTRPRRAVHRFRFCACSLLTFSDEKAASRVERMGDNIKPPAASRRADALGAAFSSVGSCGVSAPHPSGIIASK